MKKAITIIMYLLAVLCILFSVIGLYQGISFLSVLFFLPDSVWYEIKSVGIHSSSSVIHTQSVLQCFLDIIFGIIQFFGFIGVLQKKKWGLYCVQVVLITSFIDLILTMIDYYSVIQPMMKQQGGNVHLLIGGNQWKFIRGFVLEIILLVFFFLPIVKSLFEKQPPISSEPVPSFPPPASVG